MNFNNYFIALKGGREIYECKIERIHKEKFFKKMEKMLGITLVALVITVIILLILAGVAMSLITGEGGLFARANYAANMYKGAAENEAVKYNQLNALMGQYISTPTTWTVYTLGQEVIVGGEHFFVIVDDDNENKDTITLITKYNLDPSSDTQLNATNSSTGMHFYTGNVRILGKYKWNNISI